ncbi:MAG: peptidase [Xenococcaceae cyanobacterium MO_167.B52]|nr:peptidase [Xenococcaceae cyanobacterium MO_167.B52]
MGYKRSNSTGSFISFRIETFLTAIAHNRWIKAIAIFFSIQLLIVSFPGFNSLAPSVSNSLPPLKAHPLPSSLAKWQGTKSDQDYFAKIKTTPVGYLIWSQFPISVYVEPSPEPDNSAENVRLQKWYEAAQNAIAEWNVYLPLQQIDDPKIADIIILRSSVTRKAELDPETGLYNIPRAITAQTQYEFYLDGTSNILSHRMTVNISPEIGQTATLAAARHELGHALGIWGHSNIETDALYFSQVKDIPFISERDINTLKKIYQQPTKLGWKIP